MATLTLHIQLGTSFLPFTSKCKYTHTAASHLTNTMKKYTLPSPVLPYYSNSARFAQRWKIQIPYYFSKLFFITMFGGKCAFQVSCETLHLRITAHPPFLLITIAHPIPSIGYRSLTKIDGEWQSENVQTDRHWLLHNKAACPAKKNK